MQPSTVFSSLVNHWTQSPCIESATQSWTISTLGTKRNTVDFLCDGSTAMREMLKYITTENTITTTSTLCKPVFTSVVQDNQTATSTIDYLPKKAPIWPTDSCLIPLKSCGHHWTSFRRHFSQYKHFDWTQLWTNFLGKMVNMTIHGPTEDPIQFEKFFQYFGYRNGPGNGTRFFGDCPEAKLSMLSHCIANTPADEKEIYQDAYGTFRRRILYMPEYQNASVQLKELQDILGCDVYIDKFSLHPFSYPKHEHNRLRDVCLNDNRGEWIKESNNTSNFTVIANIQSIEFELDLGPRHCR